MRLRGPLLAACFLAALLGAVPSLGVEPDSPDLAAAYLERYFAMYPSRATAAGRHDRDDELEDLSAERIARWVAFNRETSERLRGMLAAAGGARHDRPDTLDRELLLRQAEGEILEYSELDRPRTDPLFWTGLPSSAAVFLLVRDDRPGTERLAALTARAERLPRLAQQAREALAAAAADDLASELVRLAAGQARSSAALYSETLPRFAATVGETEAVARATAAGERAATALGELAGFLDGLAGRASGTVHLGEARYGALFRLHTGIETPVLDVASEAEAALAAKRQETAAYGREQWARLVPGEAPPEDDRALVRRLFARLEADHATSVDELVADYRALVVEAVAFARGNGVITVPGPMALEIDRSPAFFIGQSVGGVYPAGPYAPEAKTLWYLPVPADDATPEAAETFYRAFNHHFNVMITPHEIVPGHYLQLKVAARQPRLVRALFGDGVYIEGWGTFCERLMLDLGWGGPLDRLAHLKKQLENIARTVVDVRVHAAGWERERVLAFVRDEALQDEQLAQNMWIRAITSSPQLTSYWLGYREVMGLYEDARAAQGDSFELREFMDGMMELGPVPVVHYGARMLGEGRPAPGRTDAER